MNTQKYSIYIIFTMKSLCEGGEKRLNSYYMQTYGSAEKLPCVWGKKTNKCPKYELVFEYFVGIAQC
jgi:hypothetical protein